MDVSYECNDLGLVDRGMNKPLVTLCIRCFLGPQFPLRGAPERLLNATVRFKWSMAERGDRLTEKGLFNLG